MLFYLFGLLFIYVTYLVISFFKISQKSFLKIAMLYLYLISSLRDKSIGADYWTYVSVFDLVRGGGTCYMEKGYLALNRLVGLFTSNYVGLALTVNLILFVSLYFFITRNVSEKYWLFCIFVYAANPYMYIQGSFNILRQTCAIGILLVGVNFLFKEIKMQNLLIYILCVLVAGQFHKSAFSMILVPIIMWIPWKRIHWVLALICALVFKMIGLSRLLAFMINLFGFSLSYNTYEASMLDRPIYLILIVGLVAYILYRYPDLTENQMSKKKIDLYIFSLCFLVIAVSNDMIYRVYIILAYIALPALPVVLEKRKERSSGVYVVGEAQIAQALYVVYYFSFFVGYLAYLKISGNTMYIPFRFAAF